MKRILMFDYDGVLVDSLDYFFESFQSACEQFRYNQFKSTGDFLRLFDVNMYKGMISAGIKSSDINPILIKMGELLNKKGRHYQLFAGIRKMLEELSKKNRLFIITSNLKSVVSEYLEKSGITCIESILGSESDISKTRKIIQLKNQNPESEYYYIGDTLGDMLEAREAGVHPVAITWGWHSKAKLLGGKPDQVADNPTELITQFTEEGISDAGR
jgi:phosphoglycolate phosphatase